MRSRLTVHTAVNLFPNCLKKSSANLSLVCQKINAPSTERLDLLDRIAGGKIDSHASNFLGLCKPLGDAVDNIHLRRAAKHRRVGRHEPYRPGAEDDDRFTRAESLARYEYRQINMRRKNAQIAGHRAIPKSHLNVK